MKKSWIVFIVLFISASIVAESVYYCFDYSDLENQVELVLTITDDNEVIIKDLLTKNETKYHPLYDENNSLIYLFDYIDKGKFLAENCLYMTYYTEDNKLTLWNMKDVSETYVFEN